MPPATITDIFGELLLMLRRVTSPYGGVHNVQIGARNYENLGQIRNACMYSDAALPGTSASGPKVVQWWDIRKGDWSRDSGMTGETFHHDSIALEGWFGWTEEPIGGTVTFHPGDPDETTVNANSEIVFAQIIDAVYTELYTAGSFSIASVHPTVETYVEAVGTFTIARAGEGAYHHIVILLGNLERHFQE